VTRYRASWVVPISAPPIKEGWVAVDRGRVVAVGGAGPTSAGNWGDATDDVVHDLGDVVLMPGLVNAHTHLELTHLRHAVAPASSFVAWVRQLFAARRQFADARDPVILEGVGAAIDEAIASGTAAVGDISNTLVTFGPLAESPLAAVVFYELIGFKVDDPDATVERAMGQLRGIGHAASVRTTLAAHAPYSVSPALLRAIRETVGRASLGPYSVHLSESPEEVQFVESGQGPWRTLLEELGAWEPSWTPPAKSSVAYLDAVGFLGPDAVVVHGVQMSAADLIVLAERGSTLVTCPRSNEFTGAGRPPVARFYESGVRVAVGTDSLTSAPDLNVFSELKAMRTLAPAVTAARLLDSATRQGARALGLDSEYGTIEPGKRGRILAVAGGRGLATLTTGRDVEEYLVSGIQPGQVSWLQEEP
jgi:cytosine/adenosine deaminase-related metal-dependent hydrolase